MEFSWIESVFSAVNKNTKSLGYSTNKLDVCDNILLLLSINMIQISASKQSFYIWINTWPFMY